MLEKIQAKTHNQQRMFDAYDEGKNLFVCGCPGTGKTFLSIYMALKDALSEYSMVDTIYVVRSAVATREVGFLPGTLEEKMDAYMSVYSNMIRKMFSLDSDMAYDMVIGALKDQGTIQFISTSFLRGETYDNAIIIVDESSNLSGHEMSTLVTRIGENSRIIFCGDIRQSDLRERERNGWEPFIRIINEMPDWFSMIEMNPDDIVRSGLCRAFIQKQHELNLWLN